MAEPRQLGPYEVVRLLGKGGMSEVYEVINPRLGSRHALKLFVSENGDSEIRERFQKEGRLLAKLSHPRIVRVTDFGVDGASGRPYFVMDLVLNGQGALQTLADVEPGTVDEEQVGLWYDDLREGLAYIHANGVIHRDLKLQNVLIGPDGHAVLADFGISKIFAKGDGSQIVDPVKTLVKIREGRRLVMGSIGYMAPELEMGVAASPQSDWYALGVVVYRLLTGTWCDTRTDVVGVLETYDPVWLRIVPKLLHANPEGRECLAYVAEKSAESKRTELESENRLLGAEGRCRWLWCLVGVLCIGFALATGISTWLYVKQSVPDFDAVFAFPEPSEQGGVDEVEYHRAMNDALMLTHDLFGRLKAGEVKKAYVRSELLRWAKMAREDKEAAIPPCDGDVDALADLLEAAARRLGTEEME